MHVCYNLRTFSLPYKRSMATATTILVNVHVVLYLTNACMCTQSDAKYETRKLGQVKAFAKADMMSGSSNHGTMNTRQPTRNLSLYQEDHSLTLQDHV